MRIRFRLDRSRRWWFAQLLDGGAWSTNVPRWLDRFAGRMYRLRDK